jgi:hypothetical protein
MPPRMRMPHARKGKQGGAVSVRQTSATKHEIAAAVVSLLGYRYVIVGCGVSFFNTKSLSLCRPFFRASRRRRCVAAPMASSSVEPPVLDFQGGDSEATRIFGSDEEAARYIQRKYRGRNMRKILALFPSLDQLKDIYLDEKAK